MIRILSLGIKLPFIPIANEKRGGDSRTQYTQLMIKTKRQKGQYKPIMNLNSSLSSFIIVVEFIYFFVFSFLFFSQLFPCSSLLYFLVSLPISNSMKPTLLFYLLFFLSTTLVRGSTFITISNETFEDRSAAFGPRISQNGRIGYLIEPEQDPTGCSLVDSPLLKQISNHNTNAPQQQRKDWIALVRRGGCSFITKVRYMQKSGAIAVIVGDPEKAGWVTMYAPGDTSDITIPSVFISRNEYIRLLNLSKLLKTTPVMAILQYDDVISWPFVDIFIIIFISPCVMLALFFISWKVKQKIQHRRELAPISVVSKLDVKIIDEKFLAKYHQPIPPSTGTTDDNEKDKDENTGLQDLSYSTNDSCCAICLEEYELGDAIRILPCHHQFHTCCVDAWLTTRKRLCPICKRDITACHDNEVTPLLKVV